MIAANPIKYTSRQGDSRSVAYHANDHIIDECLLFRLAQDTDQIVCEPILDPRNDQIKAGQCEEDWNEVPLRQDVSNLLPEA